jgi:hypothetical protein
VKYAGGDAPAPLLAAGFHFEGVACTMPPALNAEYSAHAIQAPIFAGTGYCVAAGLLRRFDGACH